MTTGVDMIILTGVVLVLAGAVLIVHSTRRPAGTARSPRGKRQRPAHGRARSIPRPGTLNRVRPHRLVAQDAALSRR